MRDTEVFLCEPDKLLIGKLTTKMFKPYSQNDKLMIEHNFFNLFGRKIYSNGFMVDKENKIKDSVAYDRDGNLYIVGYKEKKNDDFLKRMKEDYDFLEKNKDFFLGALSTKFKKELYFSNLKIMVISSCFTDKDIIDCKNYPLNIELYSWQLVNGLLILDRKFSSERYHKE